MYRRLIPTLLLAALALPGAAAAKQHEVRGPATVKGHGALRAELAMEDPSKTRPVVVGGRLGAVRFVDLAGDLRVQCRGRGLMRTGENERGQKVVVCRGRGGRAKAHGSKFRILLAARSYGLRLPRGVTGTIHGNFRLCAGDGACAAGGGNGRAGDERPRPPAPGEPADDVDAAPTDEEIEQALDEADGDAAGAEE